MKTLMVLVCLGLFVLAGCGGGGGEGTTLGTVFTPPVPTKAVITVSIPTLPAGVQVSAVQFKIQLPAGVTPAVLSGTDASGSVKLTGAATGLGAAGYDSAANTITFGNISTSGTGAGDFLIINCLLNSNTTATSSDFTLFDSKLIDTNSNPIEVTPTISVVFK